MIAFGRAVAVEGARRNVLTNILLPFATTQMTDTGMDPRYRELMTADLVAPVVTALVDPDCALNGQVLISGGGGSGPPNDGNSGIGPPLAPDELTPTALAALIAQSHAKFRRGSSLTRRRRSSPSPIGPQPGTPSRHHPPTRRAAR